MSALLWVTTVAGYVIQTKSISHIYSNTVDQKTDALYFLFTHYASWILVSPLTILYYCVKNRSQPKSQAIAMRSLGTRDNISEDVETQILESKQSRIDIIHLIKLFVLAVLMAIGGYTYFMSLKMSPAVDIAIIDNTSKFEIVSLLIGVCGITSRRHVLRNFLLMTLILVGVVIVSYTKATCDLLSGKLSINQETGELTDPFLFDRLKGALICGLGALVNGPIIVLWNKWIVRGIVEASDTDEDEDGIDQITNKNSSVEKSLAINYQISLIGIINLLFLGPILLFNCRHNPPTQTVGFKSAWTIVSVLLGHLPMLLSYVHLSEKSSPEFATTTFIGSIIATAIAEWIGESTMTIVTRWEVVGYLIVSIGAILLASNYKSTKHF
ncbi:LAFE_0E02784g1_1 [Lachancea fermentati]|uniref:LAFE_0E02784g1_1 n=1 Tax=Lachancea fermentati TaxID=4955 RepID=A0A1G4MCF9_LACFM|nr:LAFE_0E02784g1_1 [Lachancea fermentati]